MKITAYFFRLQFSFTGYQLGRFLVSLHTFPRQPFDKGVLLFMISDHFQILMNLCSFLRKHSRLMQLNPVPFKYKQTWKIYSPFPQYVQIKLNLYRWSKWKSKILSAPLCKIELYKIVYYRLQELLGLIFENKILKPHQASLYRKNLTHWKQKPTISSNHSVIWKSL